MPTLIAIIVYLALLTLIIPAVVTYLLVIGGVFVFVLALAWLLGFTGGDVG